MAPSREAPDVGAGMTSQDLAKRLRRHVLRMTHRAKASHVGSCLSCADIIAVLYNDVLRIDPENPKLHDRDRFILSKGHAAAVVYAALAEKGFFTVDMLDMFCQDSSPMCGHISTCVPGVDFSTGSLGHGLSLGCGCAMAARAEGSNRRTFVILSDGECQEGSTWEAAQFAGRCGLDGLTAVIDCNRLQGLRDIPIDYSIRQAKAWQELGWDSWIMPDGHSHSQLVKLLSESHRAKPRMIVATTNKGSGVSFMENRLEWHYKSPNDAELEAALGELA
jgi:transketolase